MITDVQPFLSARDWRVTKPPDRSYLSLLDGSGAERARVHGLGRMRVHPRARQVVEVQLPDGSTTTLRNGLRRWGTRRARTRGSLPLGGARYEFEHRTSRRARVLGDGVWIATAHREIRGPAVELRAVLSPDDELACALFAHVLGPGRGSVLGALAEGMAGGS
ncbi:hypothetical protein SAMN03159343_2546 [Klenkia marina]|uniref:Uncharacterized protein n=2 Tax=Klenkia marina TaxID=1960309 RepID=A0A1G4YC31_9ACTN|nr:hypothetical protein SAMN03159343_2546 [Klenkia marina]